MENHQNLTLTKSQNQENTSDKLFKAQNPDLYYETLHIEYYYFCQQYNDYFKTAETKGQKHVLFATFF